MIKDLEDRIIYEFETFKEARLKAQEIKENSGHEPIVYGTNITPYKERTVRFYVVENKIGDYK